MPDELYERDFLIWSEQQANLLRRLAAGERVNEAVDWPNLIEEVQDLGLSQVQRVASLFERAIVHLLKLRAYLHSLAQRKWRGEVALFLGQAQDGFTPSMRQRLDIPHLYARALHALRSEDARRARVIPEGCPFTLDDLLSAPPDVARLTAKLG